MMATCTTCGERPVRYTSTGECPACYVRRRRRENPEVNARSRAASLRWKDTHREANRERDRERIADPTRRGRCVACGSLMGRHVFHDGTCAACVSAAHELRWSRIEQLWGEGLPMVAIAEAIGTTTAALAVDIAKMREVGRAVPYRYKNTKRQRAAA